MEIVERVGEAAEERAEDGEFVPVVLCLHVVVKQVAVGDWLHDYGEVVWVGIASYLGSFCGPTLVPRLFKG